MALEKNITNKQGFIFKYHKIGRVLTMFYKDIMIQNPENQDNSLDLIKSGEKVIHISVRIESYKDQQSRLEEVPPWERSFSFDVPVETNTSWSNIYYHLKQNISEFNNAIDILE